MTQPRYFDVFTGELISSDPDGWRFGDGQADSYLVGPGLFDPQVNGFAGVDYQDPDLTLDALEGSVEAIRRAGCSHFLMTLITNSAEFFESQLRRVCEMLSRSPTLRETLLGFHLEGPFISEKDGFVGAHPARHVCDPQWHLFEKWQQAASGLIRMISLAPERDGSIKFIQQAAAEGVCVCLAHTDASLETLQQAAAAGASLATHLGNGCPMQMHRHDNIIQRMIAVPQLSATVIPDGIHVPSPALGNLIRQLGPARVAFTTDCVSAAGAPPGTYRLGELEMVVGEDRVVMHPSGKHFAGSGLTMAEGFYNLVRLGGLDAAGAWSGWTRLRKTLFPQLEAPLLALPMLDDVLENSEWGRRDEATRT